MLHAHVWVFDAKKTLKIVFIFWHISWVKSSRLLANWTRIQYYSHTAHKVECNFKLDASASAMDIRFRSPDIFVYAIPVRILLFCMRGVALEDEHFPKIRTKPSDGQRTWLNVNTTPIHPMLDYVVVFSILQLDTRHSKLDTMRNAALFRTISPKPWKSAAGASVCVCVILSLPVIVPVNYL